MLLLYISYVVRFIQSCIVFELKIALLNMASYNFPLFKFITNSYNWISYVRYKCVYIITNIYWYLKRRMCTRGELLTDLNKNINISIIDNHNESKIALDIIIYIIQNGERVLQ